MWLLEERSGGTTDREVGRWAFNNNTNLSNRRSNLFLADFLTEISETEASYWTIAKRASVWNSHSSKCNSIWATEKVEGTLTASNTMIVMESFVWINKGNCVKGPLPQGFFGTAAFKIVWFGFIVSNLYSVNMEEEGNEANPWNLQMSETPRAALHHLWWSLETCTSNWQITEHLPQTVNLDQSRNRPGKLRISPHDAYSMLFQCCLPQLFPKAKNTKQKM